MRTTLSVIILLLFACSNASAQMSQPVLHEEPGYPGYYFKVTEKKDNLWHCQLYDTGTKNLILDGWYKDEECKIKHGVFHVFNIDKTLKEKAEYANGVRDGLTLGINAEGIITDSVMYRNGMKIGISYRWHSNGALADSANFDGNGNGALVSWDDNGKLISAGRFIQDSLKSGRWKYYYPNGQLHASEDYNNGKLSSVKCFDDQGNEKSDCESKEAEYIDGKSGWTQFVMRNLNGNVPIDNNAPIGTYTVIVQFIIEPNGTISNIKALTNHRYGMESEAVRIIKKSGKWTPAKRFGVYVKAYRKQPITFMISER